MHIAFGEEWQHLEQDLRGRDGIAQRRVTVRRGDLDPETFGKTVQRVIAGMREKLQREPRGAECGLLDRGATGRLDPGSIILLQVAA